MTKVFQIKIDNCSNPRMWYGNKEGRTYNAIRCNHPFRENIPVFRISVLCWIYAWDVTVLKTAEIDTGVEKQSETIFPLLQTLCV